MKWYSIRRFRCARCGQRLAVHGAQVERGEVVTCQRCNQDMRLSPKGRPPDRAADEADDCVRVEL